MPAFNKALKFGHEIERLVLDRIRTKPWFDKENDPFAMIVKGNFPQYDIYSPSTNTRIEVKSDLKSKETNNFLIEVYHYGKRSALLVTEADIWVLYDGDRLIWVKPENLKDLILEKGVQQRTLTGKGDKIPKRCYLVATGDIFAIAETIEGIHEENKTEV